MSDAEAPAGPSPLTTSPSVSDDTGRDTNAPAVADPQGGAICVAVCVNDAYMLPMTVMVRSLLEHLGSGRALRLFVVQDECGTAARERALASWQGFPITAEWLAPQVRELGASLPGGGHAGVTATYLRLLLGELLPADVHRVIYLDCDMVIQDDIAGLWEMPLDGAVLGAVPDAGSELSHHRRMLEAPWNAEVGFRPEDRCFNSGVLLIDLDRWRACGTGPRALRFAQRWYDHLAFHDQDALNCTLLRQWRALPLRWNFHETGNALFAWSAHHFDVAEIGQAMQAPAIVHYATPKKPWHHHCRSIHAELFHHFLQRTQWQVPLPNRRRRVANRWFWQPHVACNWLVWRGPLPGQAGGRQRQWLSLLVRNPWLPLTWPAWQLATWLRFFTLPGVNRRYLLGRLWRSPQPRPASGASP